MKTKLFAFALITFIGLGAAIAQPVVSRGPYLNIGTTSSMIVRWRTDVSADAKIWYGTSLDTASMASQVDANMAIEHEFKITGLTASTKYYYAIGTTTTMLAGSDSGHYFLTSPPAGTKQPIRIWGIGDFGEGNSNQAAVRDAYKSFSNNEHTDVWLWFGDNAYNDGLDAELQIGAFDMYPELFAKTVLWPSLGNHDYGTTHPIVSSSPDAYLDAFTLPTSGEAGGLASNKKEYYSYDYGNVHFLSLNSEAYTYSIIPSIEIAHDQTMLTWIENDLANNTNKDWIIAYLHAPPYSDGTHTENYSGFDPIKKVDGLIMRGVRDHIVPILESYGVDLVIGGHSHNYERSHFMYGNYGDESPYPSDSTIIDAGNGNMSSPYLKLASGPYANKGGVFCVVGSSAKIGSLGNDGDLTHELMNASEYRLGSLLIEIDDDQLDAYFVDTSGTAWDQFTIIKEFPTGIDNTSLEESILKVYPNPFKGPLTVEYTLKTDQQVTLNILDLNGKQVYSIVDAKQAVGLHKYTIDPENTGLSTGAYLLQLKAEGTLIVQKTIKL